MHNETKFSGLAKAIFFTLLGLGTASVAAPDTYALKCRGGGALGFVLNSSGEFRISFKKALSKAGADGGGLQRGECAWVDRALNNEEPSALVMQTGPKFKVGAFMVHQMSPVPKGYYFFAAEQTWVYLFQTTDTILTIQAYNAGDKLVAPNP